MMTSLAGLQLDPLTAILAIPARCRRAARSAARLSSDGSSQRGGNASDLHRRSCAHCQAAAAWRVPVRRRSIDRLRRARHVRRVHHRRVQRQLYRARGRHRPADAGQPAFLSRALSGFNVRHELGAHLQQHRPHVGGDRARDAHHHHDGRHLPHARGAGSGVEIFHPRQRRHCDGAVRHDPRLHGGAARGW